MGLIAFSIITARTIFAALIDPNNQTPQFISSVVENPVYVQEVTEAPKEQTKPLGTINEGYIKNLVTSTFNQMLMQGLLKGEKGEKGEKGDTGGSVLGASVNAFNPEVVGFQTAYIPGATLGPDVGTNFAATNLSSESITSKSANFGNIQSTGNFTLQGDAEILGTIKSKILVAESISTQGLEVGSSETPIGITLYDTVTHEAVCIFSENNVLKLQAGKCGEVEPLEDQVENLVVVDVSEPITVEVVITETVVDQNIQTTDPAADITAEIPSGEAENSPTEDSIENIIQ